MQPAQVMATANVFIHAAHVAGRLAHVRANIASLPHRDHHLVQQYTPHAGSQVAHRHRYRSPHGILWFFTYFVVDSERAVVDFCVYIYE